VVTSVRPLYGPIMRFAITDRRVVCRHFGLVVVAVLTWLQIMCRRFGCRRFAVAVMTCRRFNLTTLNTNNFFDMS